MALKPHRVVALTEHRLLVEHSLLGSGFRMEHAFNDSSLHVFPLCRLAAAEELFRA